MYKQVHRVERRVSPEVQERLGRIETATLSDTMGRHGAMSHRIRPLERGMRLVGNALTVQCWRGDNLMVHKALQLAQPGDVLVIDTGRTYDGTVMGRNMSLFAQRVGVAGIVVDGSVRDTAALIEMGFPVYCVGVVPRSAYKQGVGSVNVPVTCGDLVVNPGDIVVGDDDGVVVVPHQIAEEVADAAERRNAMEAQQEQDVQGEDLPLEILYGDTWVDERLAASENEPFQIKGVFDAD